MNFNKKRLDNLNTSLNNYEPENHLEHYYFNELSSLIDDLREVFSVIDFYATKENYNYYNVEIANGFKYTTSKIDEDGGTLANGILEEFNAESFNK